MAVKTLSGGEGVGGQIWPSDFKTLLMEKVTMKTGRNSMAQSFSVKDTMTDDSYFDTSEIKLSITSLFSVQIMSYLRASDMIYSDVIDSYISEILKYKSWILASLRNSSMLK